MITKSWNQFDGGMTNEPRDPRESVQRVIKHFDNYTRSYKLTPYRSMKLDAVGGNESSLDQFRIQNFVITNFGLYGVGIVGGGDIHTQVYLKTTPTDPTAVWTTAPGIGTSASSVELNIGAVVYHNYIYGVNTGGVWKYGDITTSPTFTYNDYTAHIPTANGLVHSKDDIMYWPSQNLILKNDSGSWSVALTLPTNSAINAIAELNNYLAIACDQADGTIVIYLWDRDTSLTTLSEKIDWGVGSIKHIENIGGILCGISTTSANATSLMPRVMFKYYDGTRVVTFEEFICTSITFPSNPSKQKFNNLFYFLATMVIDGTTFNGLWKIFKNPQGQMAVSFDKLPRNDTTVGLLKGFIRWGDYTFIAYLILGTGAYTIWRTDDQANYTATSIYESEINPKMPEADRTQLKQLKAVALSTELITTGQVVTLKYRVDGGSWSSAVISVPVGEVNKEAWTDINTGLAFVNGNEFEFRVESTGGAEITEVKYKYEIRKTLV